MSLIGTMLRRLFGGHAALKSDGVEEILRLGDEASGEIDLFDDDYLEKIGRIKLPNTRIKLLQQ